MRTTPVIGVISDTHGLLRPQALSRLRGSDLIVHAGDVGARDILDELEKIAPVYAVRGNVDAGGWADRLPLTLDVQFGEWRFYVLHNVNELDFDPAAAGFHAVIAGHSHQAEYEERDGVLYFNPGSAGPQRFSLPISLGKLMIADGALRSEIVLL
jgi:uncharacterized protein